MGDTLRKNVFVVGAGASKEFGLPTGAELKTRISKLANIFWNDHGELQGDSGIAEIYALLGSANLYAPKSRFIAKNLPLAPSIDNFLHTHSADKRLVEIGKVLISRAILDAERQSSLYVEPHSRDGLEFARGQRDGSGNWKRIPPNYSWLGEFFAILVEGRDFDQFIAALKEITFIVFNYDRCIEQFILFASYQYFGLTHEQREEVEQALSIIHPYGHLGRISGRLLETTDYGDATSADIILEKSKGIHTFTEGELSEDLANNIHQSFSECELCIFLGFGFIPLNMSMLFRDNQYMLHRVLGTTKGLSTESNSIVSDELAESLMPNLVKHLRRGKEQSNLVLSDLACRELIQFHRFYLQGRKLAR